jgi:hypothetical protein
MSWSVLRWISGLVGDASSPTYSVRDVGSGAIVQQGQYLYVVNVQVTDAKVAEDLLQRMERLRDRRYVGPPLRRLDPIVLVNRHEEIGAITKYFETSSASLLFLVGLPGIGKSTLARGALEFRQEEVTALWITCEGLTIDVLLDQVNSALRLDVERILGDKQVSSSQKTVEILNRIRSRCILVLDGCEALLSTEDEFNSSEIGNFFKSVIELDHSAKVLATTRRLPIGYGKGSFGSDVYRVTGLSVPRARQLLGLRAGMSDERLEDEFPSEIFTVLQGHPKFIELLAMATHELPLAQLVERVVQASDIAEYVQKEIIERLNSAEYRTLVGAMVFRHAFSFEALAAVHAGLNNGAQPAADTLRSLSRRAILDRADGDNYFLHPILGEAMKLSPTEEASAHAAAARYMMPDEIDPRHYSSWEEGLFHLRRAAELGRSETYFRPYHDFVNAHSRAWEWAGWPRRAVDELRAVAGLATEPEDQFIVTYSLSLTLDRAGDRDEASEIIRNLVTGMDELPDKPITDSERAIRWIATLIKLRIGLTSVGPGHVEEAREIADDVKQWVETLGDAHLRQRYWELQFEIARRTEPPDPARMLDAAEKRLAALEDYSLENQESAEASEQRNGLAEANFEIGLSHLLLGNIAAALHHVTMQLRIKREVGNMPGVAAGLWNYGSVVRSVSIAGGGAALLTSDQMHREMGINRTPDDFDYTREVIEEFRADRSNIAKGREQIEEIAPEAMPFYDRGLEYWGLTESRSPGQIPIVPSPRLDSH